MRQADSSCGGSPLAPGDCALVLLASGLSRRFGGDKLLAPLAGAPLLARAAGLLAQWPRNSRLAVVGRDQPARRTLLQAHGWTLIDNARPELGQGHSLALAAQALQAGPFVAAVVCLADMPQIVDAHVLQLIDCYRDGAAGVVSAIRGGLGGPPALLPRSQFAAMAALTGEGGARRLLRPPANTLEVLLPAADLVDVDTEADLLALERQLRSPSRDG